MKAWALKDMQGGGWLRVLLTPTPSTRMLPQRRLDHVALVDRAILFLRKSDAEDFIILIEDEVDEFGDHWNKMLIPEEVDVIL